MLKEKDSKVFEALKVIPAFYKFYYCPLKFGALSFSLFNAKPSIQTFRT